MAKAKTTKAKSPAKSGDLSPQQLARIRELGRPGMGWRPWRLAKRYGLTEAKIVEIIGPKSSQGRTGPKWVADKKTAAKKPAAPKASKKEKVTRPKKPARTTEKKSQHPAEKKDVQPSAPSTGSTGMLDKVFSASKTAPQENIDIPVNPAQAAA